MTGTVNGLRAERVQLNSMNNSKFVIHTDEESVEYLKKKDNRLATVINVIGNIECSNHIDGYSFVIGEIIEQMLSVKVADVFRSRLLDLCGKEISPDNIRKLTEEQWKTIGISNAKKTYIMNFTDAVESGLLQLESLEEKSDDEVLEELTAIKGIGPWTAKMYLIFVLKRLDVLPYEDGAFMQAFRWLYEKDKKVTKEAVIKKCKKWKPYSSIASRYLYRALDGGMTKVHYEELARGGYEADVNL